MFTRRPRPAAAPANPDPAPSPTPDTARDQARALLAMLEGGAADPRTAMPPDRLRDLARDLIARVESREASLAPSRAPKDTSEARPAEMETGSAGPSGDPVARRPALFRKAQPFATATLAPTERSSAPSAVAPTPDELPSAIAPHPAPSKALRQVSGTWLREPATIRKLVAKAFRPEEAAAEHPAILALDLAGRPPREQAERLRQLPPGRVRATHRHLVELERAMP